LYFEGRRFEKDEKKMVEWIGKAAEQHDDGVIEKLHMMVKQRHIKVQNKLCKMIKTKKK
jgi:hypothetical protein